MELRRIRIGFAPDQERRLLHGAETPKPDAKDTFKAGNYEEVMNALTSAGLNKKRGEAIKANVELVARNQKLLDKAMNVAGDVFRKETVKLVQDATRNQIDRFAFTPAFTADLLRPNLTYEEADSILKITEVTAVMTRYGPTLVPRPGSEGIISMKQAIIQEVQARFAQGIVAMKKKAMQEANDTVLKGSRVQLHYGITEGKIGFGGIENMAYDVDKAWQKDLTPHQTEVWNHVALNYTNAFNTQFGARILQWKGGGPITAQDCRDFVRTQVRNKELADFKARQAKAANDLVEQEIRAGRLPEGFPGGFYNEVPFTDQKYVFATLQYSQDAKLVDPRERPSLIAQSSPGNPPLLGTTAVRTPQGKARGPETPELTEQEISRLLYSTPEVDTLQEYCNNLQLNLEKAKSADYKKQLIDTATQKVEKLAGLQEIYKQFSDSKNGTAARFLYELNLRTKRDVVGGTTLTIVDKNGKLALEVVETPEQPKNQPKQEKERPEVVAFDEQVHKMRETLEDQDSLQKILSKAWASLSAKDQQALEPRKDNSNKNVRLKFVIDALAGTLTMLTTNLNEAFKKLKTNDDKIDAQRTVIALRGNLPQSEIVNFALGYKQDAGFSINVASAKVDQILRQAHIEDGRWFQGTDGKMRKMLADNTLFLRNPKLNSYDSNSIMVYPKGENPAVTLCAYAQILPSAKEAVRLYEAFALDGKEYGAIKSADIEKVTSKPYVYKVDYNGKEGRPRLLARNADGTKELYFNVLSKKWLPLKAA